MGIQDIGYSTLGHSFSSLSFHYLQYCATGIIHLFTSGFSFPFPHWFDSWIFLFLHPCGSGFAQRYLHIALPRSATRWSRATPQRRATLSFQRVPDWLYKQWKIDWSAKKLFSEGWEAKRKDMPRSKLQVLGRLYSASRNTRLGVLPLERHFSGTGHTSPRSSCVQLPVYAGLYPSEFFLEITCCSQQYTFCVIGMAWLKVISLPLWWAQNTDRHSACL